MARESGEALRRSLDIGSDGPVAPLIDQHQQLATQLMLIMVVFTAVTLASVLLVGHRGAAQRKVVGAVLLLAPLVTAAAAGFLGLPGG